MGVVVYALKARTTAEQRYAQIEKEMCAVVFCMREISQTVVLQNRLPLKQIKSR